MDGIGMTASPKQTELSLDMATLAAGYRSGALSVAEVAETVLARIDAAGDDRVWIARVDDEGLRARACDLDARGPEGLPLFGIPFAVKDNIDAEGLATTCACPAYARLPEASATAVRRLLDAGALLIGKTNLDQFATGLVGVRSPYGVPRNPFDPSVVPGGSSSGSAVAVSSGLVSFALGTDTAGSGRVPAGFNNIVGLKPTKGMIPTTGVVPACRSLDCVSVFALTVEDAVAACAVAAGHDAADPFSRTAPAGFDLRPGRPPERFRFGVPRADQLRFFGNAEAERLFAEAVARMETLGGTAVEFDFEPFAAAASLLYAGPWVAERTHALRAMLEQQPNAIHPVVRRIVEGGRGYSAVDAFDGLYKLETLRQRAMTAWTGFEVMLVPTSGTIYRVAEVESDPIGLNSNLGYYTNFVNLMDLSALAVPNGFQADGLPAGVTLIAPAWHDGWLAGLGAAWQRTMDLPLGATGARLPIPASAAPPAAAHPVLPIAVFGAHLSGMPLNGELLALGATLRGAVRTAPIYRLHALPGTPARPALERVESGGAPIEAEVWNIPTAAVGAFLARVPSPLAIGTVTLEDGSTVHGFVAEGIAVRHAEDVTHFGGWRGYVGSLKG
ncbi:allophanate hydrolase [Azospirillum sp. RWY-5-1]|uniref:Allophanate hydrolase n=1 Tax=Azospirillum oleiclasticum TaxID=2735135 RepID=A0ABX2T6D3_9PROT|nr:allophanate hydrolase [Azospirillum oleiclasticum]NYZ11338.1 allophanate hydrolase [Azospirillum oleiclasticum]NYZ18499.1 allophanate hydrolase [Azospirillum oleiclasticum]